MAGVAALTTAEAVRLAELGAERGLRRASWSCPPTSTRATGARRARTSTAVIGETPLPCMLYNNPIAYGTDVLPEQMVELARWRSRTSWR